MRKFDDTYRHKGLRQQLVNELRNQKGIVDENVLAAINTIPRHFFLDSAFDNIAYEDRAFPIAAHQTISQPYTVAFLFLVYTNSWVLSCGFFPDGFATIKANHRPPKER